MKLRRIFAVAISALMMLGPLCARAQFAPTSALGPSTYTFTAASQSNVWTCPSGQSTFALTVPSGLTGTFTVTVGQTSGAATNNPPWAYAPGSSMYANTITNSGSLTIVLGSNYFVQVADTSYSSGTTTVSGSCSSATATIGGQSTSAPAPTSTAGIPLVQPTNVPTLGVTVQNTPAVVFPTTQPVNITNTTPIPVTTPAPCATDASGFCFVHPTALPTQSVIVVAPVPTPTITAPAAITTPASSASSVTLLNANASRNGFSICNASTQILDIALAATASTSAYTWALLAASTVPQCVTQTGVGIFKGQITGIWASANGNAIVTEW